MTRRRGRPALDENDPSVGFHIHVPGKKYDELCSQAHRHGLSVPEVARRRIWPRRPATAQPAAMPQPEFPPSLRRDEFHEDLDHALGEYDLTSELGRCFDDALYAFEHAPWAEHLDALQQFSDTTVERVPLDRDVLAAAIVLRSKLLAHDAFISAALQSAATSNRTATAAQSPSRGVGFIQEQIGALDVATRSVVIRPMNAPELTGILNQLIAWGRATLDESRAFEPRRRRGRVSDHRRAWLAHQTMQHLERIGVPLTGANHGVLANVLRVVLAAADRLEHKSPAGRTNLRNDLKRWMATYRRRP